MGRYLTVIVCGVSLILALQGRAAFGEPSGTSGCSCSKSRQDCIPAGFACKLSASQKRQTVKFVKKCGPAGGKKCVPLEFEEKTLESLADCSKAVAGVRGDCMRIKAGRYLGGATRCKVFPCVPDTPIPTTYYCHQEEEFAGQDGLLPVQEDSCGGCRDAASCNATTCSFIKISKSDCTKRDGSRESEPCSWSSSGSPRVVTSPAPVTSRISY
jgi:hypothetical protein